MAAMGGTIQMRPTHLQAEAETVAVKLSRLAESTSAGCLQAS
jgi:hypothetical protein